MGSGALNPRMVRIDADLAAITTTTYVDQTGLSFTIDANGIYIMEAVLFFVSSVTAEGSCFSVNGPASPSYIQGKSELGFGNREGNAYDWGTATSNGPAAVVALGRVYLYLVNGVNAGTLIVRGLTETGGANTTTVKRGSYAVLYQVQS